MQHNLTSPSLKNGDKAEAEVLLVSETSIPDSYAIGDVTGKAMLAHVLPPKEKSPWNAFWGIGPL
jgi:pyruvate/2-oxoglutarate dehydrogenase complex dihydrolipoamide dehydrogenase (E3) component